MHAIVITAGLTDGRLPSVPGVTETRRSERPFNGGTAEFVELDVPADLALTFAFELAGALLPRRYYAHLVDDRCMLVAFPSTVVRIARGDEQATALAQSLGALVGIPLEQMPFERMWDGGRSGETRTAPEPRP